PQKNVSSVKFAQGGHDLQEDCLLSERRLISAVAANRVVYFPGWISQIGRKVSSLCVCTLRRCPRLEERFRLISATQRGDVPRIVKLQSIIRAIFFVAFCPHSGASIGSFVFGNDRDFVRDKSGLLQSYIVAKSTEHLIVILHKAVKSDLGVELVVKHFCCM